MGIDSVGRNAGPTVPQVASGEVESTKKTEKEISSNVAPESNQELALSESAAKYAKSRVLEGKTQEQLKQAELQAKMENALPPERAEQAQRQEEIREKLDQVRDNLINAMEMKDKITSHLSEAQKEIQQVRTEIQELRNQMKQLNEEIRARGKQGAIEKNDPSTPIGQKAMALQNMERALESKLDRLIDQTQALLHESIPGAGVSLDTSALRGASLETKFQSLEGLNRHLSDLLKGTGGGSIRVSVGGVDLTAKGLDDYIAKLQKMHAQLQAEDKKLGN